MQVNTITQEMFNEGEMQTASSDVLTAVDGQLKNVAMPTYTALIELLNDTARLGLNFDIGNAYIRRSYIDEQTKLCARIKQVNDAVASPSTMHH